MPERDEAGASPKAATEIDRLVGAKIKRFRSERGISQTELGERAGGITFQQVQKYESGANRVSVSRLAQIATVLAVPLSSFLEDLPGHPQTRRRQLEVPLADRMAGTPQGVRLMTAFLSIEAVGIRTRFVQLLEAVARVET